MTLFLYLICLCSRSGGHLPSRFNRDKARPYVGALSVLITCGICHFFTLFKIFPRKQYADLVLRLEER